MSSPDSTNEHNTTEKSSKLLEDTAKQESELLDITPSELNKLVLSNMLETGAENMLNRSQETPRALEDSAGKSGQSGITPTVPDMPHSLSMSDADTTNGLQESQKSSKSLKEFTGGDLNLAGVNLVVPEEMPLSIRLKTHAVNEVNGFQTSSKSLEDSIVGASGEALATTSVPEEIHLFTTPSTDTQNEPTKRSIAQTRDFTDLSQPKSFENSAKEELERPDVTSLIPEEPLLKESFMDTPNVPSESQESSRPLEASTEGELKHSAVTTATPGVAKRCEEVYKLKGDEKEYRGLELSNRMKVLLISDPHTDKSVVALDVDVGFLSDPNELPGLANFCSRMLIVGSEKYPESDSNKKFLSEHKGQLDSKTEVQNTTFYLHVAPSHLDKALDIFVQFFISPLFSESATEMVLTDINSEHENHLKSDELRLEQLERSTSLQTHPFHKFDTGSRETLDTIPKSKNIDVRKEMLEFYQKWYSSNIMTLVVLSQQSLDELETMVATRFSEIEDRSVTRPAPLENPFPRALCRKKTYCVPVEDVRKLKLVFTLPGVTQYYKSVPWCYIFYLLSHEGPGSLYQVFKSKNWLQTSWDADVRQYREFSLWDMSVDLTEDGLSNIDNIINLIFEFLAVLRGEGPKRWVAEELSHIFSFYYTQSPENFVQALVNPLQRLPMEEALSGDYTSIVWNPKLIIELLSMLTPENIRISIAAKEFADQCTLTDPWYGIKYMQEDVNQSLLKQWSTVNPIDKLHMPPPNEFLPTDFSLVECEDNTGDNVAPSIIKDTPLMRLWYKQDTEYQLPEACIRFDIISPLAYADPLSCNLNRMLVIMILHHLQQYNYATSVSGHYYEIRYINQGITVQIEGWNDKLHRLLEKIIDFIVMYKFTTKLFHLFKEVMANDLEDRLKNHPCEFAKSQLTSTLSSTSWTIHQRLEAVAAMTPRKLEDYVARMLSNVHIEGLIYGNFTKERAIEIADSVEKRFPKNAFPVFAQQMLQPRDIEIERGAWYVRELRTNHQSSSACIYYACGLHSTRDTVILELLVRVLRKPCKDKLISTEASNNKVAVNIQLGVSTQGLSITVEGGPNPKDMDEKIETFLQEFLEILANIDENTFEKHKTDMAPDKKNPKTMSNRVIQVNSEIYRQLYNFDRQRVEAAQLSSVTKDELLQLYKKYITKDAPERRKLSIYVVSNLASSGEEEKLIKKSGEEVPKRRKVSVQIIPRAEASDGENDTTKNEVYEDVIITSDQKPTKITNLAEFQSKRGLYPHPTPFIDIPYKGHFTDC